MNLELLLLKFETACFADRVEVQITISNRCTTTFNNPI